MAESFITHNSSVNLAKQIVQAKVNHINKIVTAEHYSLKRKLISIGDGEYNTEVIYFFSDKSELRISNFENYLFKYVASSGKPNNYDTLNMKKEKD